MQGLRARAKVIQRGVSGTVADAQIANKTPPSNYGTSAAMNTGLVSGQERQSLVRFDLSAIPAGATINSAIFSAYNVNTVQSDIRLNRVTAPWSESLVTWQSFNGAFAPVQDAIFSNSLNPSSAPIVPPVQSWVSGANPNHGFLLRQPLFGTANTQFKSSEHATVAQRPRLDVCFTVTCAAGFADRNNNSADGCETAINTLTNCGACGTTCATPNAAATCATGTCAISACNAGFGNCDGKASNGGETSLTTATNCGACGTACSLANGASSCANGTCTLLGCSAGFFDCDGNTQNGCEALPLRQRPALPARDGLLERRLPERHLRRADLHRRRAERRRVGRGLRRELRSLRHHAALRQELGLHHRRVRERSLPGGDLLRRRAER